ncbi:MAG TPA: GMC oxidoreductase, partial [Steroidobacteraceae bacterium]
ELLPYFKKLEDHPWGASEYHGAGGPVGISDVSAFVHPLCGTFLKACEEIGIAQTKDFNGAHPEGAGLWQVTIKDGVRVSSASAYLRPIRGRGNLDIHTGALATRVLFAGTRATGVEYQRGGARAQARARAEVLVCGGSINSPQLLELSGIGGAKLLAAHGIAVVADSPAVGAGLQDHLAVSYFYRSRIPTLNNQLAPLLGKVRAAVRYAFTKGGPLAMSVNQAGAFVRSRPGLSAPNLHIYFNPASYSTTTLGAKRRLMNPDPYPGFLMSFNTCRPTSRGSTHIRSADPHQPPLIAPNSLASAQDVQDVFDGARLLRRLAAAGPLAAVTENEREPGLGVMSDADVLADFRARAGTVFHACGSCAMGTDPQTTVLDARLRVRGVSGLRVVDASAFPNVTSGNTNAPTMMLAEKAADLIIQDSRALQA